MRRGLLAVPGACLAVVAVLAVRGVATAEPAQPAAKAASAGAGPAAERDAVAATVKLYFQGHATGNGDFFRKAFHPDAKLFWIKDGAVAQRTSAEFAAGARGTPPPDEAKRSRTITLIDVAGDAAVARVELDYPDALLVDYLALLKVNGAWVVVNKIFHRAPPRVTSRR